MAIEPVKIPTNIQVEERIIGPLSLRQIAIVMISSGFSYVIWTALKSSVANMSLILHILSWTPTALGFAFSFVEVNGVSLFTICLLLVEKMQKPTVRTFGPRAGITINLKTTAAQLLEEEKPKKVQRTPDLEQLSSVLDAGLHKEDEENNRSKLVDAVQANHIAVPVMEQPTPEVDELDWSGFSVDDNKDDEGTDNGPLLRDIIPH